ncbi:MAG TPA: ComEC/Rec2 family competence protein, partial [Nitrospiraceae bacterium]|nr:ComEC/Rec2 family competence protein [Nitrospiraceae bacterium]
MLPAVTLTFILGLSLGSYLPYFPLTVALTLLFAVVLLSVQEFRGRLASSHAVLVLACLLGGCLYWTAYAWVVHHPPLDDRSNLPATRLEGIITQSVRHMPGRLTAHVHVTTSDNALLRVPFELRLTWRDPDQHLLDGMAIRTRAHVRPPTGTVNPRGFDYAAYLEGQGIDAVASVSGSGAVEILGHVPPANRLISSWLERWRADIRQAGESLGQPARGLFLSLTIGEQGYLPADVREWFMTTGTVHILSISGSHLGLIALLVYGAIKGLCLRLPPPLLLSLSRYIVPSRLAAILTMGPVLGYTLLAGAETATVRSCVMIGIALVTVWFGYPRYVLQALAVSAWLALLADPHA